MHDIGQVEADTTHKKKGTGVEKTVKVVPLKKFMENFKDKDTRG